MILLQQSVCPSRTSHRKNVNGEGTGKRIGDLRILGHSQVLVLSVDVFTALSNITYGNLKKDNWNRNPLPFGAPCTTDINTRTE